MPLRNGFITFVFVFFLSYVALYNYKPQKVDEIELRKNELYLVHEKCLDGWFKGSSLANKSCGVFPGNYVQLVKYVIFKVIEGFSFANVVQTYLFWFLYQKLHTKFVSKSKRQSSIVWKFDRRSLWFGGKSFAKCWRTIGPDRIFSDQTAQWLVRRSTKQFGTKNGSRWQQSFSWSWMPFAAMASAKGGRHSFLSGNEICRRAHIWQHHFWRRNSTDAGQTRFSQESDFNENVQWKKEQTWKDQKLFLW